jgi:hypothetical protein
MMELEDGKMSKVFRNIQFGIFSCISKCWRVENKELLCLQSVLCVFVCVLCLILKEQIKLEVLIDSEEHFDSKKDELTKILGFYTTKNFLISAVYIPCFKIMNGIMDWECKWDKADEDACTVSIWGSN